MNWRYPWKQVFPESSLNFYRHFFQVFTVQYRHHTRILFEDFSQSLPNKLPRYFFPMFPVRLQFFQKICPEFLPEILSAFLPELGLPRFHPNFVRFASSVPRGFFWDYHLKTFRISLRGFPSTHPLFIPGFLQQFLPFLLVVSPRYFSGIFVTALHDHLPLQSLSAISGATERNLCNFS